MKKEIGVHEKIRQAGKKVLLQLGYKDVSLRNIAATVFTGGRRDVFLGTRECQGYVEPCKFGEGEGAYDNYGSLSFGLMFHGFDYPDETGQNKLTARLWTPVMNNGYIKFINPCECTIKRELSSMKPKVFDENNFSGYAEFEKEGEIIELDTEAL